MATNISMSLSAGEYTTGKIISLSKNLSSDPYGLVVYDSSGVDIYSSLVTTWNFVHSVTVPGGSSTNVYLPTLSALSEVVISKSFVNAAPDDQENIIANASISSNSLSVWGGNVDCNVVVLGR
jgi:hypothetical protein